uniref:Uncharacterized protein n=1 Tax=Arundo donax TaxID=35708 RepID=A0A0A8ZV94_ARUDO
MFVLVAIGNYSTFRLVTRRMYVSEKCNNKCDKCIVNNLAIYHNCKLAAVLGSIGQQHSYNFRVLVTS